jgi:pyruvate formate lyase activating enzyme
MNELESCELCEWRCKVNRLQGETGVCGIGYPKVGISTLHPAPPASFDAFMIGCNFKCLGCQNYTLSMGHTPGEYIPPKKWAEQGKNALNSLEAQRMGADRLFFTGGEPTCSLPWIEEVVNHAQCLVNFDTNGFMTEETLKRVITISDSITFDIKAFSEKAHRLLTGAPAKPVLRNVKYVIEYALEKVYEFRVVVVPGFTTEAVDIAEYVAHISEEAPVCYLAFRPNFVLEKARGTTLHELKTVVKKARGCGLKNVTWVGMPDISGTKSGMKDFQELAEKAGCTKVVPDPEKRLCTCKECTLKEYVPQRRT